MQDWATDWMRAMRDTEELAKHLKFPDGDVDG